MRYLLILSLFAFGCSESNGQDTTQYPVTSYFTSKGMSSPSEFQSQLMLYYGGTRELYNQCMANQDLRSIEKCAQTKTDKSQWGWPCVRGGYSTGPEC